MKNNILLLYLVDSFAAVASLLAAFLLRFEFSIPEEMMILFKSWIPWFVFIQVLVFNIAGLYSRIWRYTSLFDLYAILLSVFISTLLSYSIVILQMGAIGYPRSVILIYLMSNGAITVLSRLSVRIYFSHYYQNSKTQNNSKSKSLILIGAGSTGDQISREILTSSNSNNKYKIVGFVDDDVEKIGAKLHGRKIYCKINQLPNLKLDYDEIVITISSASGDEMRTIVEICKQTGKRYRMVSSWDTNLNKKVSIAALRNVSYSDLLGRDEIKLDMNSIENMLQGKRVLITGAGGSIGSELVKQCLQFEPSEIICQDISEEKIYILEQSFLKQKSNTIIKTVLASINNLSECNKVFSDHRPHIVFHAAAYKHVPIQELHPWNAVNTNIGGTLNLVKLSNIFKVDKFVLVSTDKAVNPVNIMGATKRASEKLIQSYNLVSKTKYMAVRFGNVLGSSGSAIPTFQKQIKKGGPITITHPEMTRYFMSIQEATQLIIQCGSIGRDGEIFLLKMGKPIKILQMAKDLVRLSGLEPDVDIPIVYTGLRPGEKLYEELQMLDEKIVQTAHKKIMILETNSPTPWKILEKSLDTVFEAAKTLDKDKIQTLLMQILPTYRPRSYQPSDLKPEKKAYYPIKGEA